MHIHLHSCNIFQKDLVHNSGPTFKCFFTGARYVFHERINRRHIWTQPRPHSDTKKEVLQLPQGLWQRINENTVLDEAPNLNLCWCEAGDHGGHPTGRHPPPTCWIMWHEAKMRHSAILLQRDVCYLSVLLQLGTRCRTSTRTHENPVTILSAKKNGPYTEKVRTKTLMFGQYRGEILL